MRISRRGYTLIELLVVISIISTVFAVGFVSFRDFSRRQQVIAVARNLKSDLRNAQERASAGQKPDRCEGKTLDGYRFTGNSTGYRLMAVCENRREIVIERQMTNGVTLDYSYNPAFIFRPLGLGTDLPRDERVVITVAQENIGNQQTVEVSWTGEIK